MNTVLDTKPTEISDIFNYLSQFEHTKCFSCVFDKESELANLINSQQCPNDDITQSFEQMPVDISQFFSGFILTSDVFVLVSKTRVIGNIAGSVAYNEFLSLIHHIKQKKLKQLDN